MEAAGGLFILFSGTGSGFCPRFTGAELELWEFSHHCKSHYKSLQWWENSHRSSSAPVNLGQNPDPVPEKSINIPPSAHPPHSTRASLTSIQHPPHSLNSTNPHLISNSLYFLNKREPIRGARVAISETIPFPTCGFDLRLLLK